MKESSNNRKKIKKGAGEKYRGFLFYLLFAAAGITAVGFNAYFSYSTVKEALINSEIDSLKSLAQANAMSLKADFEEKENLIESIYGDDFSDQEEFYEAMDKVFCDKDFYTENDYEYLPAWKGEICRRAAEKEGEIISGPCVYRNGGYYVFYMTRSVSIGGEQAGVIQFEWNLDRVFNRAETLSNLHINNNGYCIVRNKEGKIIMSREGGKEDITGESIPELSADGSPAADRYWSYTVKNGVPVRKSELAAYASVACGDEIFTVCVAEDYDLLVKPIESISFYLTLLGVLLFAWLLVWLWFYMRARKKEDELLVRLRYEEELNEVGKTLEKQEEILRIYNRDKEITSLWGALAHEFNNWMTPVLLYAELFKNNKKVSELLPEETEELYRSARHCSMLSRQMLEFSRAGRSERKTETFNASEEVRMSIRLIERLLPENVELKAFVSKKDFYVRGQKGMLGQIILNLSNNALHAMKEKEKGILKITFGRSTENDSFAALIVEDNGSGIPEELQRHIFEPFFTTKSVKEGNGIGLTVVLRLLQEHGGYISASSKEGEGSRFIAALPAADAESQDGAGD